MAGTGIGTWALGRRLFIIAVVIAGCVETTSLRASACAIPGCLDASFGTGGLAQFDLAPGQAEFARDLVLQPNGSALTAGYFAGAAGEATMFVARTLSTGVLDSSFGIGGIVKPQFTTAADNEQARTVLVAPDLDGNPADFDIVAVGNAPVGMAKKNAPIVGCAIARLNSDGSFATGFGTGGKLAFTFMSGSSTTCHAATLDAFGRIVLAVGLNNGNVVGLARLYPDGTFDPSFGTSGKVLTAEPLSGGGLAVVVDVSGNVVLGVETAVLRRLPSGLADTSFGSSGRVATGLDIAGWAGLAIDPLNRIIVSGVVVHVTQTTKPPRQHTDRDVGVIALLGNGQRDLSFGVGGLATIDAGSDSDEPTDVTVDASGRIVVSAWTYSAGGVDSQRFIVIRLNADGTPDFSFGTAGIALTQVDTGVGRPQAGVVVNSDGILLAGVSGPSGTGGSQTTLARYVQ